MTPARQTILISALAVAGFFGRLWDTVRLWFK